MLNVSILLQKKFWFEKKLYFFCQEKPVYIFTLSLKVKIILGQKENLLSPFLTEKLLWRLTLEMHQSAPSSKKKRLSQLHQPDWLRLISASFGCPVHPDAAVEGFLERPSWISAKLTLLDEQMSTRKIFWN